VIAGAVELVVKPEGKVTVIVLPGPRAPVVEVVKPTVQVEAVLANSDVGAGAVKVTAGSDVAPALEMLGSIKTNRVVNNTRFKVRIGLRTISHRTFNWSKCR
jgi:hypothetical protein